MLENIRDRPRQKFTPSLIKHKECTASVGCFDRIFSRNSFRIAIIIPYFGRNTETPKQYRNKNCCWFAICLHFWHCSWTSGFGQNWVFRPKLGVLAEISCFGHISVSGFLVTWNWFWCFGKKTVSVIHCAKESMPYWVQRFVDCAKDTAPLGVRSFALPPSPVTLLCCIGLKLSHEKRKAAAESNLQPSERRRRKRTNFIVLERRAQNPFFGHNFLIWAARITLSLTSFSDCPHPPALVCPDRHFR